MVGLGAGCGSGSSSTTPVGTPLSQVFVVNIAGSAIPSAASGAQASVTLKSGGTVLRSQSDLATAFSPSFLASAGFPSVDFTTQSVVCFVDTLAGSSTWTVAHVSVQQTILRKQIPCSGSSSTNLDGRLIAVVVAGLVQTNASFAVDLVGC